MPNLEEKTRRRAMFNFEKLDVWQQSKMLSGLRRSLLQN
jgi:hypothetical protein